MIFPPHKLIFFRKTATKIPHKWLFFTVFKNQKPKIFAKYRSKPN